MHSPLTMRCWSRSTRSSASRNRGRQSLDAPAGARRHPDGPCRHSARGLSVSINTGTSTIGRSACFKPAKIRNTPSMMCFISTSIWGPHPSPPRKRPRGCRRAIVAFIRRLPPPARFPGWSASSVVSPFNTRRACARSKAPSQRAITRVPTPMPMMLVRGAARPTECDRCR